LEEYTKEVDSRPPGRIEPLPVFRQVEPYRYQASNLRSPFEPPVLVKPVEGPRASDPNIKPDPNRPKEFLEQYTIASLTMVGTLSRNHEMYALIQDADGGVHRVQTGDYMGTDYGKIQKIDEASIELIEIVSDGAAGWVRRERTVNLGGGNLGGGNRG